MTGTWGMRSSAQVGSCAVGWHGWEEPGPGPIAVSCESAVALTNVFCGLKKNGAPGSTCFCSCFLMNAFAASDVWLAALSTVAPIDALVAPGGTSTAPTVSPASGPDATTSFTVTVCVAEIGSKVTPSEAVNVVWAVNGTPATMNAPGVPPV